MTGIGVVKSGRMTSILLMTFVAWGCVAPTARQPGDTVLPYPFAKDSFRIRINDLATDAGESDTIHVVYYADGSLKSGTQMENRIDEYRSGLNKRNYVFVSIAHFGQYRVKRRRDFIAPSVKTAGGYRAVSENYGQADSFYSFLAQTIIPLAEKKFSGHVIERSFVGHSLGGLFATYLLVHDDSLFSNLYALSPSLWIDDYYILQDESRQQQRLNRSKKNFRVSCGSREDLNRIEAGVRRMGDILQKRNYPGIHYQVKVHEGKTHNSAVEPALKEIFDDFVRR